MPQPNVQQQEVSRIVSKANGGAIGSKLKSLRPSRNIRPGKESKGELTRGGGYTST